MSHRLQVLIPEELDAQLAKAAHRHRMSKGEWVRTALEESLRREGVGRVEGDPLTTLASLEAPTADLVQMLSEIDAGRK